MNADCSFSKSMDNWPEVFGLVGACKLIPISARLARIDFPPFEPVVCVFSICVNRLPSDPPSELCKLSLCRKPLNASTNNCVAATTVEKLA